VLSEILISSANYHFSLIEIVIDSYTVVIDPR
jgi:hypothetical protein